MQKMTSSKGSDSDIGVHTAARSNTAQVIHENDEEKTKKESSILKLSLR